jgi:hypothetical protein
MPSELELQFHRAMVDIYRRALEEAGYNATRYIQMVGENGGRETAKTLINASTPSDGYTELWKRNRLDLTVEAVVVQDAKWHPLFEPEEIERAKQRLKDYKYDSPKGSKAGY